MNTLRGGLHSPPPVTDTTRTKRPPDGVEALLRFLTDQENTQADSVGLFYASPR